MERWGGSAAGHLDRSWGGKAAGATSKCMWCANTPPLSGASTGGSDARSARTAAMGREQKVSSELHPRAASHSPLQRWLGLELGLELGFGFGLRLGLGFGLRFGLGFMASHQHKGGLSHLGALERANGGVGAKTARELGQSHAHAPNR